MSVELVMPKAGLTMIEGAISKWKVSEGAQVKKGEAVMEFENEKTTMDCESNADGFLHILAESGTVAKVGEPIAVIAATKEEYDALANGQATQTVTAETADTSNGTAVVMPKAGLTMIEGTISRWKVAEGAQVKKGEAVFEFENEKTTMEGEATADGFLHQTAKDGETIKVGEPVGYIAATQEEYNALASGEAAMCENKCEPCAKAVALSLASVPAKAQADGHVRATGLARNIAKSEGLNLAEVAGTGPNGRIVAKDVYAFMESAAKAPSVTAPSVKAVHQPSGEVVRSLLSGKRKAIAKNMRKSFETMAPLTVFAEIDVTNLMELRKKYVAKQDILGVKISLNDIMMLATIKMLRKHPELNATFDGEAVTTYPYVNLGMAVGVTEGLTVPILKNAEQYSLVELSKALKDLAIRAKENALVGGEQSGGTFTVTNVGMFNIDFGTPVIFPPQVAILGFGTAKRKLVDYQGDFVPRTMMHMMLSFDHQVIDGRLAGEVLGTMKELLENPELIFA